MPQQASPKLFAGLTFLVAQRVPERVKLLESIRACGGGIAPIASRADYCLVDPKVQTIANVPNSLSYKFVTDSVQEGDLQDAADYRIHYQDKAERPVGSLAGGAKTTRTRFTRDDDQILYNWMTPFKNAGGKWKGNEIYKQLAFIHPHHPMQSWRARYVDYHGGDMLGFTITEDIDHRSPPHNCGMVEIRSPKRRRIEGPQNGTFTTHNEHPGTKTDRGSVAETGSAPMAKRALYVPDMERGTIRIEVPVQQRPPTQEIGPSAAAVQDTNSQPRSRRNVAFSTPTKGAMANETRPDSPQHADVDQGTPGRQEMLTRSYRKTNPDLHSFSLSEARQLYRAVPIICNTTPGRLKTCWSEVAQGWEEGVRHTAEELQHYFETAILPEYKRRNEITTDSELEDHIHDVLATEEHVPTITIKREQTPDPRSPIDQQKAREAERARIETGDVEFSETSDGDIPDSPTTTEKATFRAFVRASSSARKSPSPVIQRISVHANEGRKRASQNSNSTQTTSQPSQEKVQSSVMSPKRKLFGQVLDLSQSLTQPSPQVDALQTSIEAVNKVADTEEASSSLPTAEKPPESYQLPSRSTEGSQDSGVYDTAKQMPSVSASAGQNITEQSTLGGELHEPDKRASSPMIDLLEDGEADLADDLQSQAALSDTGSEYLAFDTAPERSQMWDTGSNDDHSQSESSDGEDNEMTEVLPEKTHKRPPTPIRGRTLENNATTEDEDEEIQSDTSAYSVQHERSIDEKPGSNRVETQALFKEQFAGEDASQFDLPPPEGGWEAIGLDDAEAEDPDAPLETVELPEARWMKQRVSPVPSDATIDSNFQDENQDSPIFDAAHPEAHLISSNELEETESDDDEPQQKPMVRAGRISKTRPHLATDADVTGGTRSATLSAEPIVPSPAAVKAEREDWTHTQFRRYKHLPKDIVKRFVLIALRSTSDNLSSAPFVMRDLITSFQTSERTRELRFRQHNKTFIPKNTLSRARAEAFLPQDELGVWTQDDDNALTSRTAQGLRRVELKHTKEGARRRTEYLRSYHKLREEQQPTGRVGSE